MRTQCMTLGLGRDSSGFMPVRASRHWIRGPLTETPQTSLERLAMMCILCALHLHFRTSSANCVDTTLSGVLNLLCCLSLESAFEQYRPLERIQGQTSARQSSASAVVSQAHESCCYLPLSPQLKQSDWHLQAGQSHETLAAMPVRLRTNTQL